MEASSILRPLEIPTLKHARTSVFGLRRKSPFKVVNTTCGQLALPRLGYVFCIGFSILKSNWVPKGLRNHQPIPPGNLYIRIQFFAYIRGIYTAVNLRVARRTTAWGAVIVSTWVHRLEPHLFFFFFESRREYEGLGSIKL